MAVLKRSSDDLTVEDRAMSVALAAYRGAMLPRDGDAPEECMWAAVHAVRDVYEAEVERLREALEPFVAAYEAINFLHCPDFRGPLDLAFFDHARKVLRG